VLVKVRFWQLWASKAANRGDPLYEEPIQAYENWSADSVDWGNIGWIGRADYLQVPSLRN
jgi:hypothetical protein